MKLLISWFIKVIKGIAWVFWPVCPVPYEGTPLITSDKIQVTKENYAHALELKMRIYDSEVERRNIVESRASLFIGNISVAASIVVGASALIGTATGINISLKISMLLSFILAVYTARTIWFSVKSLSRMPFHVLTFNDVNIGGGKKKYQLHLITTMTNIINQNHSVINLKVDHLVMAQEYYKRSIIVITLYALFILLFTLAASPAKAEPNFCEIEIYTARTETARNFTLKGGLTSIAGITTREPTHAVSVFCLPTTYALDEVPAARESHNWTSGKLSMVVFE